MYEKLITAPAVEPVTVEEQCIFSHIDVPGLNDGGSPPGPNLDRVLIQSYVTAAREHVEQLAKVAMISQVWLLSLDSFPNREDYYTNAQRLFYPYLIPRVFPHFQEDSIDILRRPVNQQDTASPPNPLLVKYINLGGNEQLFDPANYVVFADKITLKPGKVWPTTAAMQDAVRLTIPCGYGATAAAVPERLKLATKFLAGHWFENRVPIGTQPTNEVMMTLSSLLQGFKLYRVPR